jgi:hypothetical protein
MISLVAAGPSSSGIWTSMRTTSYARRSTASTASRPSLTTSARCPSFASSNVTSRWFTGWSSATRIRSGGPPSPDASPPAPGTPVSVLNSRVVSGTGARRASVVAGARTVNVTVEPTSGVLTAPIVPPMSSQSRRQMARPSPVPP